MAQKMASKNRIKWFLEADYLQACNCNYGCPCEFEAPPTMGFCEGIGAWRIIKGKYGKVSLDGLALGFAAHWPKAMHFGGGTAVVFIDEKANKDQREALFQIASGQAGGAPFEIIVMTFAKVLEPQYVPFTFQLKGRNSSVRMGNKVLAEVEPIKNPVTGEVESIKIEHGTGFIFKKAECVSAKVLKSNVFEIKFS